MTPRIELSPDWNAPDGEDFCRRLPALFADADESAVVYASRNLLLRLPGPDGDIVAKRFRPKGWQALISRWRSSKAERSFSYARRLQEMDIGTPEPLAFVEHRQGAVLREAYALTRCLADAWEVRRLVDDEGAARPELLHALGAFVGKLHKQGVWHRDLTPGNVLVDDSGAEPSFYLVDVNRMRFGSPLSGAVALANLVQLGFSGPAVGPYVAGYADYLNSEVDVLLPAYHKRVARHLRWRRFKSATRPWRRRLCKPWKRPD